MSKQVGKLEAGKTGVEPGPKRELKFNTDKRLFSILVDWKDEGKYLKDHYGPVKEWIISVSLGTEVQSTLILSVAEDKCEIKGLTPGKEYLVELFWKKTFPAGYAGLDKDDYYYLDNQYACSFGKHITSIGIGLPKPDGWPSDSDSKEGISKLWESYMQKITDLAQTRIHKVLVVGFAGHGKSSFFNTALTACAYNKLSTSDDVFTVAEVKAGADHVTISVCYHPLNLMANGRNPYLENVSLIDTFGVRTDTFQGDTFRSILRGHAGNGWEMTDKALDTHPKYVKDPKETDRCSAVIFVLAADIIDNKPSVTDTFYTTLKGFMEACEDYKVRPVFLISKVDLVDPLLAHSYKNVFTSESVLALANRLHQAFGISLDRIFPAQNYHGGVRDGLIEIGVIRCIHAALVQSNLRATILKIPALPVKVPASTGSSSGSSSSSSSSSSGSSWETQPGLTRTAPPQVLKDWDCPKCTLVNKGTADVCGVCRTPKPQWSCLNCTLTNEPGTIVCSLCGVKRPPQPDQTGLSPGSSEREPGARRPSGGSARRPSGGSTPAPQKQTPKKPQPQPWTCSCKDKKNAPGIARCSGCKKKNPDGWTCEGCETFNGNSEVCIGCQLPRPVPWTCGKCTTENPLTEPTCKTCANPNPEFWQCPACTRLNGPKVTQCDSCHTARPKDWKCQCKWVNSGAVDHCVKCRRSNPKAGRELLDAIFLPKGLDAYSEKFIAQGYTTIDRLKNLLQNPEQIKEPALDVKLAHRAEVLQALKDSKIMNAPPSPRPSISGGALPVTEPKKPELWKCWQCRSENKMGDTACASCGTGRLLWKCSKDSVENSFSVNKCVTCATLKPYCLNQEEGGGCFIDQKSDHKHFLRWLHKCKDEEKCTQQGDADHTLHFTHPVPEIPGPGPGGARKRPENPMEWTDKDVIDWLKEDEVLTIYADKFAGVDGPTLLNLQRQDIIEQGLTGIHTARLLGKIAQLNKKVG